MKLILNIILYNRTEKLNFYETIRYKTNFVTRNIYIIGLNIFQKLFKKIICNL